MEERALEEKQKVTAAEAKMVKLQAKNKNLNDENTQLRQILQQIQVRASKAVHRAVHANRSIGSFFSPLFLGGWEGGR